MSITEPDSDTRRIQDEILKTIIKNFVSVDDENAKTYVHHFLEVVELLESKMREDRFFDRLYQKRHHTGSYWDGLKVGLPTEFDINLIYKLPFEQHEYLIMKACPAFVMVNIKKGLDRLKKSSSWENYKKLNSWFDESGYLIADNVRQWQESILGKIVADFTTYKEGSNAKYLITMKKAGPAITLGVKVLHQSNITFDIDVVPAFEFSSEIWPSFIRSCPEECVGKSWHIVPKPYDSLCQVEKGVEHRFKPLFWRLSFHDVESSMLHDCFHLKPTVKFLKKLRDVREQSQLHSYALKTIFLWETEKQGKLFWKKDLSFLFLQMLQILHNYLSDGQIPFFWDKEFNLLQLKSVQLKNTSNNIGKTLDRILKGLKSGDIFILAQELCTSSELQKLKDNTIIQESVNGKIVVTCAL